MKLWVARHGYAGDYLDDPKKERERGLKPEGVDAVKAIAQAMIEADEAPNVVFCSPFIRAVETADILAKMLGINVNSMDDLSPYRPIEDRILELMAHDEVKRMMIVGHVDNTSPAFNNFGGDWEDLKMGEVRRVKIDRKTGEWILRWGVKPSDLGYKDYGG